MKKIFLGFVIAAVFFTSLNYHLVITDEGMELANKDELGFKHTYIDTKGWSIDDYARNPEVAAILAKNKLKKVLNPSKDIKSEIVEESKSVVEKGAKAIQEEIEKAKKNLE